MEKRKLEAMVTKFVEKLAIIMLERHRKFCRCGLTHLDATHTFKNRPNTYAPPCTYYINALLCNANTIRISLHVLHFFVGNADLDEST